MSAFDSAAFESWAEINEVSPKSENNWPDPEPIRNELRAVAPLRPEMIPEPLRACLADITHRMQCPIDFVASASICDPNAYAHSEPNAHPETVNCRFDTDDIGPE